MQKAADYPYVDSFLFSIFLELTKACNCRPSIFDKIDMLASIYGRYNDGRLIFCFYLLPD